MSAPRDTRRVRPMLLILLWIWVVTVAVVLDMFWDVEEFDRIRPRAKLYQGMRVAAHKMVGVPVPETHHHVRAWRAQFLATNERREDVEAMVKFCQQAGHHDVPALKNIALTAQDPLAAGNAIGALGRLLSVAHDPELVALVSDGRDRVRKETILALGKSGDPLAIPLLEPLLADEDPAVRMLAIRAVGEIGGPRATELLRGVLDRPGRTQAERGCARAALE